MRKWKRWWIIKKDFHGGFNVCRIADRSSLIHLSIHRMLGASLAPEMKLEAWPYFPRILHWGILKPCSKRFPLAVIDQYHVSHHYNHSGNDHRFCSWICPRKKRFKGRELILRNCFYHVITLSNHLTELYHHGEFTFGGYLLSPDHSVCRECICHPHVSPRLSGCHTRWLMPPG